MATTKLVKLLKKCLLYYGNLLTEKILKDAAVNLLKDISESGTLNGHSAFEVYIATQGLLEDDIETYTDPLTIAVELKNAGYENLDYDLITNSCFAVSAFMDLTGLQNSLPLFNNCLEGIFFGNINSDSCTEVEPEHIVAFVSLLENFHSLEKGSFLRESALDIQQYCALIFIDNGVFPLDDWDMFTALEDVLGNFGDRFSYVNFNELLIRRKKLQSLEKEINLNAFLQKYPEYIKLLVDGAAEGINKLLGWNLIDDKDSDHIPTYDL